MFDIRGFVCYNGKVNKDNLFLPNPTRKDSKRLALCTEEQAPWGFRSQSKGDVFRRQASRSEVKEVRKSMPKSNRRLGPIQEYVASKWRKLNRVPQDPIVPVEKRQIKVVKKHQAPPVLV